MIKLDSTEPVSSDNITLAIQFTTFNTLSFYQPTFAFLSSSMNLFQTSCLCATLLNNSLLSWRYFFTCKNIFHLGSSEASLTFAASASCASSSSSVKSMLCRGLRGVLACQRVSQSYCDKYSQEQNPFATMQWRYGKN